uniref:Reverse transcriptase domain-containing protein n=1 Tax=Tanacetum cinerariifolium TaxID=118510 RepID=A0A699HQH2_TANCI|nr:hypothetical protein [Tanacetum cinerariifolium]
MIVRKRVGPLPTHRLAVRHSVDCSSSGHFSSNDYLRDSSSSSSLKTSLDSSIDALSDSASSRSSSDHSLPLPSSGIRLSHHLCSLVPSIHHSSAIISARPSHDSSSVSSSRKRNRSLAASIPLSSPIPGALSYARADHLPSHRRIRSSEIATDLEVSLEDRFEPYVPRGTDLEMDVDVVVDRDEVGTDVRGLVKVRVDRVTHPVTVDDIPKPTQEKGAIETREGVNEQIDHRLAGALGAHDVAKTFMEMEEMEMKEVEIEGVLSKKRYPEDGNRVMKLGYENELTAYTKRFQELVLLCTRMVANEEEKVERLVSDQGLRIEDGDAPKELEASLLAYKYP